MKEKTFIILLSVILLIGTVITTGHLLYAFHAYEKSSIIHFVSEEFWP